MAKSDRKINTGSIRLDDRVYKPGDEDELNGALSPADAKRLSAPGGPLSGSWTGSESSAPVTSSNVDGQTSPPTSAPARGRGRPLGSTSGPRTPATPAPNAEAVGEGEGPGAEPAGAEN